jgi:hypothetical protein
MLREFLVVVWIAPVVPADVHNGFSDGHRRRCARRYSGGPVEF